MKEVKVSIIIPTYNYAHLIADTLNSILKQSYDKWECIIIDDGSGDNTEDVVKQFIQQDQRFIYIKQKNTGPNAARNNGIQRAKGTYIQFLDADDNLEIDKLKYQVRYLSENINIDIVYGNTLTFIEKGKNEVYKPAQMPRNSGGIEDIGEDFIKKSIMINSALIRKEVFGKVGLPSSKLIAAEDWEFWIRCLHKGCIFHYIEIPNTNALVRRHPNSATQQTWRQDYWIYRMRKTVDTYLQITSLKSLNLKLMQRDKSILPYLVLESWKENKKTKAKKQMWQTAKATRSIKHFLYAFLMPLLNIRSFENLLSFSFRKIFVNGKRN